MVCKHRVFAVNALLLPFTLTPPLPPIQPLHTLHVNIMRHYYREVSDIFLTYFIS